MGEVTLQVKPQTQCAVGMYEGHLVLVSLFFTSLVFRYVHFTCDFSYI